MVQRRHLGAPTVADTADSFRFSRYNNACVAGPFLQATASWCSAETGSFPGDWQWLQLHHCRATAAAASG